MRIINTDNYPNLSSADLARYDEIAFLIRHIFMMGQVTEELQNTDKSSGSFCDGYTAATTSLMKFHLCGMVDLSCRELALEEAEQQKRKAKKR